MFLVFLKKRPVFSTNGLRGWMALCITILIQACLVFPAMGALEFPGPVEQPLLAGPLSAISVPWSDGNSEFLVVGDENGDLNLIYHLFNDVNYGLFTRENIDGDILWLGRWEGSSYGQRGIVALTANPDRLHFVEINYSFPYIRVEQSVILPEDPGVADFISHGPNGEAQMAVSMPGIDQLVILRQLDGVWTINQTLDTGDEPRYLTAIDLNGDQILELVTADRGELSGTIGIYQRQPDGLYSLESHSELPGRVHQILAEDFNLDGLRELAVSYSDLPQIDIMTKEANGWVTHHTLPTSLPSDFFQIVPVSGGNFSIVSSVEIRGLMDFFHFNAGTWIHEDSYYVGCHPRLLAACDLNGDGMNEVACLGYSEQVLTILLGNTLPGFWGYPAVPLTNNSGASTLADMNGDGLPDLIVGSLDPTALSLYLRNSDGGLSKTPIYQEIEFYPVSLSGGNFLGTATNELVALDAIGGNLVFMTFEDGAGFVTHATVPFSSALSELQVADIDHDGHLDIYVAQASRQQVDILYGLGEGTFAQVLSIDMPTGAFSAAALALNQDAWLDLVVTDGLSRVWTLVNLDGRTFDDPSFVLTNSGSKSLSVADLDGDSDLDVVVGNFTSESITILENLGDGTLDRRIGGVSLDGQPTKIQCRDMNQDGLVDVVVTLSGDKGMRVVEALDIWDYFQTTIIPTSDSVVFTLVEDFNFDERPDILNLDSELLLGLIMFNTERLLVSVDPTALSVECNKDEFVVTIQPDRQGPWALSVGHSGNWQTLAVDGQPHVGTLDYDDHQWILKFNISDVGYLDATMKLMLTVGTPEHEESLILALSEDCFEDTQVLPAIRWRELPWPNPFNPRIHSRIELDFPADVDAAVFDLAGRRVATLLAGHLPAGVHDLTWDGKQKGRISAAGVYLLRIRSDHSHLSRKIILLK